MIQLLPVLSGIMWGSAGIFVRILTEYGMDSITIVESRVVPAVVILLCGLFFFLTRSPKNSPCTPMYDSIFSCI